MYKKYKLQWERDKSFQRLINRKETRRTEMNRVTENLRDLPVFSREASGEPKEDDEI